MNILLVVGMGAVLLLIASRTYPFWIAKVFRENDDNPPPSERFADGKDYVKTPTQVVFAYHFASIAGAGPILGPILALAFGWGPASSAPAASARPSAAARIPAIMTVHELGAQSGR